MAQVKQAVAGSLSPALPAQGPLRFAGYAALFDVRDRGGDVIRPGAFDAALGKPVPLLWQHDPSRPIGLIEQMQQDAKGLRVVGQLHATSATAREAAAMLREGAVRGLSFGYRVRQATAGPQGRGGLRQRELTALDLVEVSLVTLPMQPGAQVIALG